MREIKFRFWDNPNKKMWFSGQEGESIGDWTFQSWFDSTSHKLRAAMVTEFDCGYNNPMVIETHLIPMQYTGVNDKNGQEIYEGDLVKTIECNTLYEVSFNTGAFCLKSFGTNVRIMYNLNFCEVIGNIYETPELLEVV